MRCNVSSVVITLYKLWAERSRSREGRERYQLVHTGILSVEHHQMTNNTCRFIIYTAHTFPISLLSECAENQFRIFLLHISLPRAALLCTGSAASAASAVQLPAPVLFRASSGRIFTYLPGSSCLVFTQSS